jgi:hypothetical protein
MVENVSAARHRAQIVFASSPCKWERFAAFGRPLTIRVAQVGLTF